MIPTIDRTTWPRTRFGDVVRQVKDRVDPVADGLERYVAGEHMESGELKIAKWGLVGEGYLGPAFHARFRPGQVLYGSRRTYLRKVALADFEGVCANTTFVLEVRDPVILLPELLPLLMSTEAFHAHSIAESKGSVNPYVNWPDLAKFEFDLPPTDEQRRIADLLWAAEKHRSSGVLLMRALNHAEETAVDRAFSGGIPERRLGDILATCQYGSSARAGKQGRYAMLRMTNLLDGEVVLNDLAYVDMPDEELQRYKVEPGDVLFNRTNSHELVGKSGIFAGGGDCVFASYLIRLRVTSDVLAEYLNLFINSRLGQSRIRTHVSRGVSQANVSASNLQRVSMPVPSLECQRAVVEMHRQLRVSRAAVTDAQLATLSLSRRISQTVLGASQ